MARPRVTGAGLGVTEPGETTGEWSKAPAQEARLGEGDGNRSARSSMDGLSGRALRLMRRPASGALLGTLIVYTFFAITAWSNGFATLNGTASWMDQAAELAIVAIPVGVLMIAGEFDLSIASMVSAGSLTVSIGSGYYSLPLIVSILLALFLAVCVGLINGLVTVRTGLPSFIVTLATYLGLGGIMLTVTRGLTTSTTVSLSPHGWLDTALAGSAHQFNISILWAAAFALWAGWILSRSVFGNWILATGGDKAVARQAGVPTARVKVTLFVATAMGAAWLGIIQAFEYDGGQLGQGQNFIFDAIVAAVVGGILLQGGYGSAIGVVLGAMTYSIVNVGIYYTGWDADLAQVIIAALLLAAVLANNYFRALAARD
jgi:simple sugar transport system permease protein